MCVLKNIRMFVDVACDALFLFLQMWCRAASYRVKDYIDLRNSHSPSKYRFVILQADLYC